MQYMGYELTTDLSREAYDRDKAELLNAFNPRYVTIDEMPTPDGCLGLFQITVHAPSDILTYEDDKEPKPVDELEFFIRVNEYYPAISPTVYFAPNRRLASVNTYRSGKECIDKWGKYSSLRSIAEKTIRDIIHDPEVTKYESMAYGVLKDWQQSKVASGAFPTLKPPSLILRESADPVGASGPANPPPLPGMTVTIAVAHTPAPPPLPGFGR